MQTFLPFPSFSDSARILDNKRLNKQRLEVTQILTALKGGTAWRNHPAVKMWAGHEFTLRDYLSIICKECNSRGFADNSGVCTANLYAMADLVLQNYKPAFWDNNTEFHLSHRLNLIFKDPQHYASLITDDIKDLLKQPNKPAYVWPIFKHEYIALPNGDFAINRYTKPRKIRSDRLPILVSHDALSIYTYDSTGKAVTWLLEK